MIDHQPQGAGVEESREAQFERIIRDVFAEIDPHYTDKGYICCAYCHKRLEPWGQFNQTGIPDCVNPECSFVQGKALLAEMGKKRQDAENLPPLSSLWGIAAPTLPDNELDELRMHVANLCPAGESDIIGQHQCRVWQVRIAELEAEKQ